MTSVFLFEDMTFDQLFRYSEPKRVKRSATVRGPPLEINGNSDAVYHIFNFKSFPSTTGLRHHGYIRFKKPALGNTRKPLQHIPCEVDCTCFQGDAPVLMADGTYKPIAQIVPGDEVYTHRGRIRKVLRNNVRQVKATETVWRLALRGFPGTVTVTGEHPFYALRGNDTCLCGCGQSLWKQDYRTEHALWSPALLLGRHYRHGHWARGQKLEDRSSGHFEWVPVNDFRAQEWFLAPWLELGTEKADADFARLFGYYVAEGCLPNLRGSEVRLAFNLNERLTLVQDAVLICKRLGYKARVYAPKQYQGCEVRIFNKAFKAFCAENAGVGSSTKRLSRKVMAWNGTALRNLFLGMILGDGWFDPERGAKYLTSSYALAGQASTLLSILRVRHTLSRHCADEVKTVMFQVLVPQEDAVEIREAAAPYLRQKDLGVPPVHKAHSLGYYRKEGHLRPLLSAEKIEGAGTLVYDLTVEEDVTYIVGGVAVYDCPDFRYRWAWSDKQRGAARIGKQSMNQCINRAPRKTNPDNVPGLCKHILAARDYIYGMLAKFPGGEPDTGEKLAQIVGYANKRWQNFDTLMAKAKDSEKWYAAVKQATNQGQAGNIDLIYDLYQAKGGQFIGIPAGIPQRGGPFGPAFHAPGGLAVPPGQRGRGFPPPEDEEPPALPPRQPRPPGAGPALPAAGRPTVRPNAPEPGGQLGIPPGQRGRGFPPAPPAPPPAQNNLPIGRKANKPIGPAASPSKRGPAIKPPRKEGIEDFFTARVSRLNGSSDGATNNTESMSKLNEALKLIEEIEQDQLEAPSEIAGSGEMGMDAPPPSEPPVSDEAVGADTEGNVVLQLLADIKDLLAQLVGAEEGEGELGPGGPGELGPEGGFGPEDDLGSEGGPVPPPGEEDIPVDAIPEPDEEDEDEEEEGEKMPPRHAPEGEE
jgi:hypothetical protein